MGSSPSSSFSESKVSNPSKELISRPETMINAFGLGSSDAVSNSSRFRSAYSFSVRSCDISDLTVGATPVTVKSISLVLAAVLNTP